MDVILLSKIVGELILDYDEVALPGLGTFVAEMIPACFSDRGFTINPPYRRLSFRKEQSDDTLLLDFYARNNSISVDQAASVLKPFLADLKEQLENRKIVVFPGLGRLRATKSNDFFFVADEELNIFPDGFAMHAVSLKSHREPAEEVHRAVESMAAALVSPVDAVVDEGEKPSTEEVAEETYDSMTGVSASQETLPAPPVPKETGSGVERETVRQEKAREGDWSAGQIAFLVLVSIVLVIVAVFAVFLILAQTAPDFVDRLLYSPEQLEIVKRYF